MPFGAKSPCRQAGCSGLVDRPGYCEDHKKQGWHTNKHRSKRMSARPWRRKRQIVIRSDKGLCRPCSKQGVMTVFNDVDHIVPVSKGGSNEIENLQCICTKCHNKKTAKENR